MNNSAIAESRTLELLPELGASESSAPQLDARELLLDEVRSALVYADNGTRIL